MTAMGRRQILGAFATSSLAIVGGVGSLFPEARLLRANPTSATLAAPNGRTLRGHLMTPGVYARTLVELHRSRAGERASSLAQAQGFAESSDQGFGVSADWDDGEVVGAATIVPMRRGNRRGFIAHRSTREGELVGVALEDEDGWVRVWASTADGLAAEASFTRRIDGSVLIRGNDGNERLIAPPPAARGGRKGLAAPVADPICNTICNWILTSVCAVSIGLTAIFICAWIAIDSLGTLAIACGLFFIGVAIVTCNTVPEWACSQVCA